MEATKNVFVKGLNKDLNSGFVPNENYIDAHNVSLVDNGNFFALQNIKGTINVQDLISASDVEVLGAFNARFVIGDVSDIDCIVIFTAQPGFHFRIWCYDTVNDVTYEMYQSSVSSEYFTDNRVVDAVLYPENGVDYLYFTDFYHEIGKLRCEIPLPYTANFLSEFDVSLGRRGALGKVSMSSISRDGSLFTGSYQVSYQLIDPTSNKYSKWSLLSNPFIIFRDNSASTTDSPYAGYGLGSDKSMILSILSTDNEFSNYTHFRLAIIENIYPEGTLNANASVTELKTIADHHLSANTLSNIKISANLQNNLIPLSEIVTDHAAIQAVKTLEVRSNRLLAGNIVYKELSYDRGTPTITGGNITMYTSSVAEKTDLERTNFVGYFRGECYRFAISYFDEFGNFSSPSVIDMSSVTHNQATTGPDFKFPGRNQIISGARFVLLDNNQPVQLGLQLAGINNHPTWARGFVILRAPRKKDIQFQSPMVPMMSIYGPGALRDYPSRAREGGDFIAYPDAQPMGPSTTFVPMNLFWPKLRAMVMNKTSSGGSNETRFLRGETFLANSFSAPLNILFPPQSMYTENNKYVYNSSHALQTVDAAALKVKALNHRNIGIRDGANGDDVDTELSATFYALTADQYYYDDAWSSKPALRTGNFAMNSYTYFDNLSEGKAIGGRDVMLYSNLETDGIKWSESTSPQIQRCAVVEISGSSLVPINTIDNGSRSANTLTFAGGLVAEAEYDGNKVSHSNYFDFYNDAYSRPYKNTVEIVNCIAGLTDQRYGSVDARLEYISTGTHVVFTDAELVTVAAGGSLPKTVTVYGGDCIVSPHVFKLNDTVFNLPNQTKFISPPSDISTGTLDDKWTKSFKMDQDGSAVCLPIPLKAVAQYIQIYLESEYDGEIMDINYLKKDTTTAASISRNGLLYNDSTLSAKTPLTYNYNVNLSAQNNQKLFFSDDPLLPEITNLRSRMIYSDLKVYQSNIEGFDIFRVLNYYDLPETYGGITKLIAGGDSLYAIQEFATNYIGIGERVLETTDANQLAVKSGDVIGNVIMLNNKRGTQHLKSVVNSGGLVFFTDNVNKTVNKIDGQGLNLISDQGVASAFRDLLSTKIPEKNLVGVYDPIKKEYWIANNSSEPFCYIWNDALSLWVSNYEFSQGNVGSGLYTNRKLYLVGKSSDNIVGVHEMYTGNPSQLFGVTVDPRVTFIVNPSPEYAKRFDAVLINSSDRLSTLDIIVERESSLGNQISAGIDLATVSSRGEGNFKAKLLRDADNARLRGLNGQFTLKWLSGEDALQVSLVSTSTSFTPSHKIF